MLAIEFAESAAAPGPGGETVSTIIYTIDGRRHGVPEAILTSVVNRYGAPSVARPMTWCARVTDAGVCSLGNPRLVFEANPKGPQVLTLVDGRQSTSRQGG